MKFTETCLKGVFIVEIEKLSDDRGFFARSWCQKEFEAIGLTSRVVQANLSANQKNGTLRGMHYQIAPYQECKLVRCTRGAIFDVIIDLRPDSPTYKQWTGIELTADNYTMLFVPEDFAHGFQTRFDDPTFGIQWPLAVTIISAKDKSWPDFGN
jgi:dTDP-4-dehydrorhamnose 3,5-epimerase